MELAPVVSYWLLGAVTAHGAAMVVRPGCGQAHACRVHSQDDVNMGMTFILSQRKVARATHNIMVRHTPTL